MNIVIESTEKFEQEINELIEIEKSSVIKEINNCAELFLTEKSYVYRRKLNRMPSLLGFSDDRDSSLYALKIARKLVVILTVDEDPIFEQVIFTLFRVVRMSELNNTYKGIAQSLYQTKINHHYSETAIL